MPVTLSVGVNTYVTLQEAEDYFCGELDESEWLDLSLEQKKFILVAATRTLDENFAPYLSTAYDSAQQLGFPRKAFSFVDPVLCLNVFVEDGEIPVLLKKATLALAQHIRRNKSFLYGEESSQDWSSVELGPLKIEREEDSAKSALELDKEQLVPGRVTKLMRPLTRNGNSLWFRAN